MSKPFDISTIPLLGAVAASPLTVDGVTPALSGLENSVKGERPLSGSLFPSNVITGGGLVTIILIVRSQSGLFGLPILRFCVAVSLGGPRKFGFARVCVDSVQLLNMFAPRLLWWVISYTFNQERVVRHLLGYILRWRLIS